MMTHATGRRYAEMRRRGTSLIGKKLKHEKLEETKHGLFRDCFVGALE
jgi:hypothetical protein